MNSASIGYYSCQSTSGSPNSSITSENAEADLERMFCVQINGTRVYGPPSEWIGPPPSPECELFIKKVPKNLSELDLLPHLKRFGQIYEFRLMMDYSSTNRGFCFVRYANEQAAANAFTMLRHFFIAPGKLLEVRRSYDKCRLFVGNIPKQLARDVIEHHFRQLFPDMIRLVMYKNSSQRYNNRGFAFVDFPSHQLANKAKIELTGSNQECIGWGQPMKIVWANPQKTIDKDTFGKIKTLFIRNIELSIGSKQLMDFLDHFVNRTEICKISRIREFAFVEFRRRHVAEMVKKTLKCVQLHGNELDVQWALPNDNSIHNLKLNDFVLTLQLKCFANQWDPPVFVYGRIFGLVQYVAVYTKTCNGERRAFFMEIPTNTPDIHARACEVIVSVIDDLGYLPNVNFVLKVNDGQFHIIAIIPDLSISAYIRVNPIDYNETVYWPEMTQLILIVSHASETLWTDLNTIYQNSLSNSATLGFIKNFVVHSRILGCLPTNHPNTNSICNENTNDIILVTCDLYTMNNITFVNNGDMYSMNELYDVDYKLKRQTYRLVPVNMLNTNTFNGLVHPFIAFGTNLIDESIQNMNQLSNIFDSNLDAAFDALNLYN